MRSLHFGRDDNVSYAKFLWQLEAVRGSFDAA